MFAEFRGAPIRMPSKYAPDYWYHWYNASTWHLSKYFKSDETHVAMAIPGRIIATSLYSASQKMSQVWLDIALTHIHQFLRFLVHIIIRDSKIGCTYNFLKYLAFTYFIILSGEMIVMQGSHKATKIKFPDIPGRFLKIPNGASRVYHFSGWLHLPYTEVNVDLYSA